MGIAGNFALGALMTAGIGLYAPCMVLVSLLGMGPATAFPIMMGSCALLMPAASVRFVREGAYDPRAALGLTLAGIPACSWQPTSFAPCHWGAPMASRRRRGLHRRDAARRGPRGAERRGLT